MDKLSKVNLTEKEVKAILFYLSPIAKGVWMSGSYQETIAVAYNKLNSSMNSKQSPKEWCWASSIAESNYNRKKNGLFVEREAV